MKPKTISGVDHCVKCVNAVRKDDRFCSRCGIEINWEDAHCDGMCPLCDYPLSHVKLGDIDDPTHAYFCDECPFVGIEYYNQGNIDDLHKHLSKYDDTNAKQRR